MGIQFNGNTDTISTNDGTLNVNPQTTFGGEVGIAGTLTYEDVTNIDSVGIITARSGIDITGGNLTILDEIQHSGDTDTKIRYHADDKVRIELGGVTSAFSGLKSTSGAAHAKWGINVATPAAALHIDEVYNHQGVLRVTNGNQNSSYYHQLEMSGTNNIFTLWKHYDGTNNYNSHAHGSTGHMWYIDGQEKLRIDTNGALLLSSAPDTRRNTKGSSQFQALLIEGTTNNTTRMSMIRSSNDDNGSEIQLIKTRGTSVGSVTKPNQNDYIGSLTFIGADDSDLYSRGAEISVQATGTPANDRCPSDIMFSTTPTSGASTPQERLRIASDGNIGVNQTSPQALLHIGNYETTQNVDQSSVTQYFIDSTRSLKIARCDRGSISSAAWYDVAVLSNSGYSYRCQVSIGGDFTQDVVDIDIQMAYGATLGNKYSMQIHAKSACAHSNDRIIKVRVASKSNVNYLQVYLQNVNSNTNGKSVLETTCGIYAQNGADNAYPMFAAASGTYSNICTTFPDFGVHASWDITVNSSHVRSYTALTGGGQEYITAENAGSGTGSHGTVGRFTAPMRGLYQVNLNAKSILDPAKDQEMLLSLYGSMTYDAQNVWTTNSEIYDPRGAVAGAQAQQGEGNSWYFRMAAYDYFSIDWYRPAATGYTNGGGDIFNISVLKMG